jgi:hypothetical protein
MNISDTALTNLDALSSLVSVGATLYIRSNPMLQDLSGLDGLISAGGLNVVQNPQLVRFPAFAALMQLNALAIIDNATLSDLTLFHDSHYRQPIGSNLSQDPWYAHRALNIEVGSNPELEFFGVPMPWKDSRLVRITDNAKLREIDLNTLETLDFLTIFRNGNLESVRHRSLVSSDTLEVYGNPRLPTADLDAVSTYNRAVINNAP